MGLISRVSSRTYRYIAEKMPTSYSVAQSKRLGAAILKFLEYHGQNARLAPDQEEGVSVAIQCLSLVFDAKPEDAKDIPELMEVYNKEAGDRGIPEEKEVTEEDKKKGESAKTEGNTHMKAKEYQKAIDEYTKAVEFNPKSEVYFCNRAAAYTNINKFHEALDDCKKAIAINPDYAKAFSRMGLIYSKLSFFTESESCYNTAIKLEPDNEGYKKNHEIVKAKADEQRKAEAEAQGFQQGMMAAGGAAGPAGADGAAMPPGMMDAYSQFAQNPEFQSMAENVMQNPNMKGMVDNFMSSMGIQQDPNAPAGQNPMEQMANAMGQNGASMGDLMALGQQFAAHMQKENPEMIGQLRTQMQGGMGGLGGEEPPKTE